jgi:PAS domain S-box-containing protein
MLNNRFMRLKLLVGLGVILIVSFFITNLFHYNASKMAMRDKILEDELPLLTEDILYRLKAELNIPITLASTIAHNSFIIEWLKDGERDATEKISPYLRDIESRYNLFTTFIVSTTTGNYYTKDGKFKTLSKEDSRDSWFYQFIDSNRSWNLNVDSAEQENNALTVFINFRVENRDGELLAVNGAGVKIEKAVEMLQYYQIDGRDIFLIDSEGYIRVHRDREKVLTKFRDIDIVNKHLQSVDEIVISEHKRRDGKKVYLSSVYIKEFNWYLIVEQCEDSVMRDVNKIFIDNLFMTLLISVGVIVLATIVIELFIIQLIQKHKRQIEVILSNILSPMLITSKISRRVLYANREASKQYKLELDDLIGSHIENIYVEPNDALKIRDALRESGGTLNGMELKFKSFDGKEFDALLSLVEIEFYNEPAFLGMVTDITVQKQREMELHHLHKDIRASIEYASFIQRSLVPKELIFQNNFRDFFIIWEPRDVVGGDIYFVEEFPNGEIVIMVIDCTGHGVPGAFLTMLVKAIEKQIMENIKNREYISPSSILKVFNKKLKETLSQQREDMGQSGFDGAVVVFNKFSRKLKFSGAKLPIYFLRDSQLTITKGDRQSIGYSRSKITFSFKEHSFQIEDGDIVYLSTDGFLDQTGGAKNFPFGTKNFKKLIEENSVEDLESQKLIFLDTFQRYKGEKVRNDDLTILALEF